MVQRRTVNAVVVCSNHTSRTERRRASVRYAKRLNAAGCKPVTHEVNTGGPNPPLTTIGTVDQPEESASYKSAWLRVLVTSGAPTSSGGTAVAADLGSAAARRGGSSPSWTTNCEWRNWKPRGIQGAVVETPCGFDSRLADHSGGSKRCMLKTCEEFRRRLSSAGRAPHL